MVLNRLLDLLPPGSMARIHIESFVINLVQLKHAVEDAAAIRSRKKRTEDLEKEHRPFDLPAGPDPSVSIIIPVYNKFDYTYTCLKSIADNTGGTGYEVIVVDNASTDETTGVGELVGNLRVLRNERNAGFVEACNQGAEAARGEYVLFLNNDTKVLPGWLEAMVSVIERDPSVGLVGAKLVYPTGRLQEAGGIVWNDREKAGWNYGRNKSPNGYEYNYLKEVDYCSGACILLKKDLFERCGRLDMRYAPAYFEDTDLAFTVRKLGYRVVYQPLAEVVHFEGQTAGTDTSSGFKRFQTINHDKFYRKWKGVLEAENFRPGEDFFLARDRSAGRRRVLFIDHCVPTHDRDAGSLSTYMYLKLLVEMGCKVVFVPYNFVHLEPYTTEFQQMGIEVMYGITNFSRWIKENGRYFHDVVLSRPHVAMKYLPLVKRHTSAKVLYNMHDLHHLREMRRYEVEKKREILRKARRWKKMEYHIFDSVDTVLTFSEDEAGYIRERFPEREVRQIPLFFYDEIPAEKDGVPPFEERSDMAFLGGFNHLPNADAVEFFVKDIFPKVKEEVPDARFLVVGGNPPDSILGLASDDVIFKGFVKDLTEVFDSVRVFVSPLRFGAGLKGKIVTSLSYGVPVVTTSIGNEGLRLEDGVNGVVTDDPGEFADGVVRLYRDGEFWRKVSENSVSYVKENFSTRTAREKLEGVLSEIDPPRWATAQGRK